MNARYPDYARADRNPDWERPALRECPRFATGPMRRRLLPRERLWDAIETTLAACGWIMLAAILAVGLTY